MCKKGFTLTELMIAATIGGILILIISAIAIIGFTQMNSLKDRLAAEENVTRLELLLRQTIGQAVDITGTNITYASPYAVSTRNGGLRASFNWTDMTQGSNWNVIGHFLRESGGSGLQTSDDGNMGNLMPTAIFYRRPTATTSGVLFFNLGRAITATNPNYPSMSASYSEPFIDRISLLQMEKNVNVSYNKVTSVRFRVSIRYHEFGSSARVWCPVQNINAATAGCVTTARYRDLQREFTILIRNNLLKSAGAAGLTGSTSEERTMGPLYFFRLISPMGM